MIDNPVKCDTNILDFNRRKGQNSVKKYINKCKNDKINKKKHLWNKEGGRL